MGVAAYNRGSAVISRQIAADLAAIPLPAEPINWDIQRDALKKRIAELESEMRRARRLIALLRAEKTTLREEIAAARAEAERAHKRACEWATAARSFRRRWIKLSAIIRACLSPAQYHAARADLGVSGEGLIQ